jgi:hypothetical protein
VGSGSGCEAGQSSVSAVAAGVWLASGAVRRASGAVWLGNGILIVFRELKIQEVTAMMGSFIGIVGVIAVVWFLGKLLLRRAGRTVIKFNFTYPPGMPYPTPDESPPHLLAHDGAVDDAHIRWGKQIRSDYPVSEAFDDDSEHSNNTFDDVVRNYYRN